MVKNALAISGMIAGLGGGIMAGSYLVNKSVLEYTTANLIGSFILVIGVTGNYILLRKQRQ